MASEQELRLHARITGAKETASEIEGISDAQTKLAEATDETIEPTKNLNEAQREATAHATDYTSVLSRIHPALGALADSAIKTTRILGDLAFKKIELAKISRSLTTAIVTNARALVTLGAGGAVALGIMAITRAIRAMREEFEKATQAIDRQVAVETRLQQQQGQSKQTLEDLADLRREGGFTPDQASQAQAIARTITGRAPFLGEAAISQAITLGGPLTRSIADIEKLATAIQQGRYRSIQ